MKRFEYLDHTSEAEFRAYGETLEEVFVNSALAMTNLMVDVDEVGTEEKINIRIESSNPQALLYDFLDELLYVKDADGLFISKFENVEVEEESKGLVLKAVARGDEILNYDTKTDVKAPTYNDMLLEETKEGWMSQVVVDV